MESMSLHASCHDCGWQKVIPQHDGAPVEPETCLQCGSPNIENNWVRGNPLQNALSDAINRVFGQN